MCVEKLGWDDDDEWAEGAIVSRRNVVAQLFRRRVCIYVYIGVHRFRHALPLPSFSSVELEREREREEEGEISS